MIPAHGYKNKLERLRFRVDKFDEKILFRNIQQKFVKIVLQLEYHFVKPDDDARADFWRCKNAICTFEIAPYLKPANFAKQRKGRIFGPAEKVRNPPHGVACVCALSTDCADWL